jgi:hypothetical protein
MLLAACTITAGSQLFGNIRVLLLGAVARGLLDLSTCIRWWWALEGHGELHLAEVRLAAAVWYMNPESLLKAS